MAKPKVILSPVADQYAGADERIIEFSDRKVGGGLIRLSRTRRGRLNVAVYRCDSEVDVVVGRPDKDEPENWDAQRTALAMAQEGLRRVQLFAPHGDVAEAVSTVNHLIARLEETTPPPI